MSQRTDTMPKLSAVGDVRVRRDPSAKLVVLSASARTWSEMLTEWLRARHVALSHGGSTEPIAPIVREP